MSIKFKALGLSLLAVVAASAFAVVNASAETQSKGHFIQDAALTIIDVYDKPPTHQLELGQPGFTGITCHEASYAATLSGTTITEFTVTPVYDGCTTTGGSTDSVTVHTNGCTYKFTQPNKESAKTEHTLDLVCPTGKTIEITHATCTVSIHAQTVKGIGYTTINEQVPGGTEGPKHAITLTADVSFAITRHGGFCALLATNSTGTLKGSATVFATNFAGGKQVNITATGSVN